MVISRVIIRVTPFRALTTLLITYLLSPLPLQVGLRVEGLQFGRGSPWAWGLPRFGFSKPSTPSTLNPKPLNPEPLEPEGLRGALGLMTLRTWRLGIQDFCGSGFKV